MLLDLKRFAFDCRLKQQDLSEVIGIAQSQVSAMMNGKREIKEEHIKRLKDKYGDIISNYFFEDNTGATQTDNSSINPTNTQTMDPLVMDYINTLKEQLAKKDEQIKALIREFGQKGGDESLSRGVGAVKEKQEELTDNK